MKQASIHAAETRLSKLIEAALDSEEIVIARGSKPVVRLVPIARRLVKIGLLEGQSGSGPDFLDPLPDDGLDLWDGGQ